MFTPRNYWRLSVFVALVGLVSVGLTVRPVRGQEDDATKKADSDKKSDADKAKASANTPPPQVQEALEQYRKGDHPQALELLKKAREISPYLPPAKVMLATFVFSDQKAQQGYGRRLLEDAVADEVDAKDVDPEAHILLGKIALQEGRISDADLQFQAAVKPLNSYKANAERRKNLQNVYLQGVAAVAEARQQWGQAVKDYNAILALKIDNAMIHQRLANALFFDEKPDDAYRQFVEAVKLDKTMPPAALGMAMLYSRHKEISNPKSTAGAAAVADTNKWLAKAIAESPKDARALVFKGEWLFNRYDLDKALDAATKALAIDSKAVNAKVLCGIIARYQKKYEQAEKYLNDVVQEYPGNFQASNELALTLIAQKSPEKRRRARDLAVMNFNADKNNAEAAATLGWVACQFDQIEDAAKLLNGATSVRPFSRDTAYYAARLSDKIGNQAKAQELLDAALNSNGPFANLADAESWKKELALRPKTAPKGDKSDDSSKEAKVDSPDSK